MSHNYKIRSVDLENASFVIEFDGIPPLNFWIPHDDNGILTGQELEDAIQRLYPWDYQTKQKFQTFTNTEELIAKVEPSEVILTEEQIRQQRNLLLLHSDWTQLPDAQLTPEKKAEWETYRQALRDVTSQSGFPATVDWPVAP
jgi:hypothetical protein